MPGTPPPRYSVGSDADPEGSNANRSRSPRRRRSHRSRPRPSRSRDAGGREVVIERVIECGPGNIEYPMLTRTNYQEWALVMKVNLQVARYWAAIDPGDCTEHTDRLALTVILRGVPSDMWSSLAKKESAREAWLAVKTMRIGVDRVREANAQLLRRDFNAIAFKLGESTDEFAIRLTTLAENLRSLGDGITDAEAVKKLLQVVPEKLTQAVALEMLLDLNNTPIEEVVGRLRVFEQRTQPEAKQVTDSLGRLMLCEERRAARPGSIRNVAVPAPGLAGMASAVGADVGADAGVGNLTTVPRRAPTSHLPTTSASSAARRGTGPRTASPRRRPRYTSRTPRRRSRRSCWSRRNCLHRTPAPSRRCRPNLAASS